MGPAGAALLLLQGGAQAQVGAKSQVRVTRADNAIQLQVLTGKVFFRSTPKGRVVGRVADGTFRPAGNQAGSGWIALNEASGRAQFAAEKGNWMLAANNGSVMVRSGDEMAAELTKSAGHVAVVVAKVLLVRGTAKLAATPQAPVYWGDDVNTIQLARARIALNDGSVLNVGPASSLKIVQENAAAQQTQLQLIYGRVRSKVMHITKPGGKFQIHSRLGVAGVVGTDFYLALEGNTLQLVVFEGVVHFCNLAGVCVDVRRNQNSQIMPGEPPTTPTQTPKGLLLQAENSTNVPGSVAVERNPTNAEIQKRNHHRKLLVWLIGGGIVGGLSAIGFSNSPGDEQPVTPVVP